MVLSLQLPGTLNFKKMRKNYIWIFGLLFFVLASCEEKIDVDLNSSDPRMVVEAKLTNKDRNQIIHLSRTVNFDAEKFDPINDALVNVIASNGRIFTFTSKGNGEYTHNNFAVNNALTYTLNIKHNNKTYESKAKMPEYVEIDSMGVTKEDIFRETYYFVNLKFRDPVNVPNYYIYEVSINDGPFKFNMAFNDKFNDGQEVTHQIGGRNQDFKAGDKIIVRRQLVSKDVYTYWNEFQSTNPGSAAPGNPSSNLSNNALGYFGISNQREYSVVIQDDDILNQDEVKASIH